MTDCTADTACDLHNLRCGYPACAHGVAFHKRMNEQAPNIDALQKAFETYLLAQSIKPDLSKTKSGTYINNAVRNQWKGCQFGYTCRYYQTNRVKP